MKLVPYDHDISKEEFDGLFISNGPGNPELAVAAINNVKKVRYFKDTRGNPLSTVRISVLVTFNQ